MEYLVAICAAFAIFFVVQGDDVKTPEEILGKFGTKLKKQLNECIEELKVSMHDCENQYMKTPESLSEECKCVAKCWGDKMKVLNADGTIMHDEVQKKLDEIDEECPKKFTTKLYEKCKDADKGEGGCEGSHKMAVCFAVEYKAHKKEFKCE